MAEEYLQSIEGDDCVIITDREERKQAFLAGLKAGRQWHDLRKDPNDLPKRNGNVVQNQDGDKVTYDYRLKMWRWTDSGTNGLKMVAWCELPTFDKE